MAMGGMAFGGSLGGGETLRKQVEIFVDVNGQQAVDELRATARDLDSDIDTLGQQFRNQALTAAEFLARVREIAPEFRKASDGARYAQEYLEAVNRGFASVAEARAHDAAEAKQHADAVEEAYHRLEAAESTYQRDRATKADEAFRRLEIIQAAEERRVANEEEAYRRLEAAEAEYQRQLQIGQQKVAAMHAAIGSSFDSSGNRARAASRAVLEFSRGLEDFVTAGPIGALNNIPTFFYNIGQSIGWTNTTIAAATAGVSLLATASYMVYKNWDLITKNHPQVREFFKTLGESLNPFHVEEYAGALEHLQNRVEELTKNKHRLAIETAELDSAEGQIKRIKAGLQEFERGKTQQSKAEQESGKRVEEIFREAPGGREAKQRQLELDLHRRLYEGSSAKAELDKRQAEATRTRDIKLAQAAPGFEYIPLQNYQEELERINNDRNAAMKGFEQVAQALVGNLFADAISGRGPKQEQAQEQLAAFFGGRPGIPGMAGTQVVGGPTDIGGQVRAASRAATAEEREREEQAPEITRQRKAEQEARKKALKKIEDDNQAEAADIAQAGRVAAAATQGAKQAEQRRTREGAQRGTAVERQVHQAVAGAKPIQSALAEVFLRQQLARENRRVLAAQPGGKATLRRIDLENDRNARAAQAQIEARDRRHDFQAMKKTMTPQERALLRLRDRMATQRKPMTEAETEAFAGQIGEQAFAGLGGENVTLPGIAGQEAATQGLAKANNMIRSLMDRNMNIQEAIQAAIIEVMGGAQHQQDRINRIEMNMGRIKNGLHTFRETQLNTGR